MLTLLAKGAALTAGGLMLPKVLLPEPELPIRRFWQVGSIRLTAEQAKRLKRDWLRNFPEIEYFRGFNSVVQSRAAEKLYDSGYSYDLGRAFSLGLLTPT